VSFGARAHALGKVATRLSESAVLLTALPPPSVAVSSQQWHAVQEEAQLTAAVTRLTEAYERFANERNAEGAAISRRLRPAAKDITTVAEGLARMTWQMAAFAPDRVGAPSVGLAAFVVSLTEWLKQLSNWMKDGLAGPGPASAPDPGNTGWDSDGASDPIAAMFGVSSDALTDARGAISDARLLAFYRPKLDDLARICIDSVSSINRGVVDVFSLLQPLLTVLRIDVPLSSWGIANAAYWTLRQRADIEPRQVEAALSALRDRTPARLASRRRLDVARRAVDTATGTDEGALAELSAYRILIEGQMRPWCWALLQMGGADGPMPMVNELRDRLAATDGGIYRQLASVILPQLRNADAHEQAHIDPMTGEVILGDASVALDELRALNRRAVAQAAGLELAVAIAQSQVEPAARAYSLRPGARETTAEAFDQAEQRYGHAGLKVWSFRRERHTVIVVLDDLHPHRCNPCFVATVQAYEMLAGVTRFQIALRGREGAVIDLPSTVLRENYRVFEKAARWFAEIPQETFLPCLAFARLSVELPGAALRASAWLALNDLQHAIDDAELLYERTGRSTPQQTSAVMAAFERRVLNLIGACQATLRVMPSDEAQPLELALELAREIRYAATGLVSTQPTSALIAQVLRERDRLPVPAVLPTLDPRPIDVIDAADNPPL
jgi:hypothetical protein